MNKKIVTWILIADAHRARIFCNEGPGKGLKCAINQEFIHMLPANRDLAEDKPGSGKIGGYSGHYKLDFRTDLHRHEKEVFAKELAQYLDEAAKCNEFERLIVVAPPQCLGDLRKTLSKNVADKVTGELAKDLTHIPEIDLPNHLAPLIKL